MGGGEKGGRPRSQEIKADLREGGGTGQGGTRLDYIWSREGKIHLLVSVAEGQHIPGRSFVKILWVRGG